MEGRGGWSHIPCAEYIQSMYVQLVGDGLGSIRLVNLTTAFSVPILNPPLQAQTAAPKMSNTQTKPALCSANDFLNEDLDYIVVGGGTAGLCVAARLTENPDVKVGVLEAGKDLTDDPQVYTPSLYPTLIGREKYDWCFETVPQESADGKKYSMPRGKLLGGSSGINYLVRFHVVAT